MRVRGRTIQNHDEMWSDGRGCQNRLWGSVDPQGTKGWKRTRSKPVNGKTEDNTENNLLGQHVGKIRSWSSEDSSKAWI